MTEDALAASQWGDICWMTPQELDEARTNAVIARKVEIEQKVLARTKPQAPEPRKLCCYRPPGPGKRKPSFPKVHGKTSLG